MSEKDLVLDKIANVQHGGATGEKALFDKNSEESSRFLIT